MRTLRRTNRVVLSVLHCQEAPFLPVLYRYATGILPCRVSARMSSLRARERKLTFLSVTDMYVRNMGTYLCTLRE